MITQDGKAHTGTPVTKWEIRTKDGEHVATHVREDKPDGTKKVFWKRPDGKPGLNGTPTQDLPLYGIHELGDPALVVVTEGEKARDALTGALRKAGLGGPDEVAVVGTVTGAASAPSSEVLGDLEGKEVVLWPDADDPGRRHMEDVAWGLIGVTTKTIVYDWPGAKAKGADAADHPAVLSGDGEEIHQLLKGLCSAPEFVPKIEVPEIPEVEKNGHERSRPISAAELMAMEFPPTSWVVPDVLPEGVTLLAGKPKKGKSWMALGFCESVAVGGVALGTKRVEQGDTLYLALEDNVKRLKKRLKKVLDGRDAPERMHLHTEWPRLDEGGAEALDAWLTEHPDARLVVIDTLAKIRKPTGGANVYADDYAALEALLPLAAKHNVAIVVVHHLRKAGALDPMDEISSSTGLTGGVDGFLILRRTPGSKGPTLFVEGRDIEDPTEYALHWNMNTATWTIEGTAEEVHVSKERADILLTLNRSPEPMTPKEVWEAMGGKRDRIRQLLVSMFNDGQVLKDDKGRYSPAHPTNPPDPDHSDHSDHRPGNAHSTDHSGPVDHSTDHRPTADTYRGNRGPVTAVIPVIEGGPDHDPEPVEDMPDPDELEDGLPADLKGERLKREQAAARRGDGVAS